MNTIMPWAVVAAEEEKKKKATQKSAAKGQSSGAPPRQPLARRASISKKPAKQKSTSAWGVISKIFSKGPGGEENATNERHTQRQVAVVKASSTYQFTNSPPGTPEPLLFDEEEKKEFERIDKMVAAVSSARVASTHSVDLSGSAVPRPDPIFLDDNSVDDIDAIAGSWAEIHLSTPDDGMDAGMDSSMEGSSDVPVPAIDFSTPDDMEELNSFCVLSPSRTRSPGTGILSPARSVPHSEQPRRNAAMSPLAAAVCKANLSSAFAVINTGTDSACSTPMSEVASPGFPILSPTNAYSSEEYSSEDDRFASWTYTIRDEDIKSSTRELFNTVFQPHPLDKVRVNDILGEADSQSKRARKRHMGGLDDSIAELDAPAGRRMASISDFQVGKPLGAGKFGTLYLCRARANHKLLAAVKVIFKRDLGAEHARQIIREIRHLDATCHSPHVISLFDFFMDSQKIYLVMEYAPGGDLYHSLCKKGSFSEPEAASVIRQAALAIRECHNNGIIHRDIKPENFVWGAGDCLKLIDFGWSAPCSPFDRRKTLCGTLDYLSPELVTGREYGQSVDVWCLAVLAFELLAGSPPFEHEDLHTTKLNIKYVSYKFPQKFSAQVKDLLSQILKREANARLTVEGMLNHPWLVELAGPP